MIEDLFGSGTLNLIYTIVSIVSFLFALLSLIGAEIGEVLDFDIDGDTGFDFVSISPFALAMFGSTFGVVGLITRLWMEMDAIPSILWATGLGIIIGGVAQAFFFYVLSPSTSSHFELKDDATGREAEVITTVPQQGLGEVIFNNISGRVKLGARSSTGESIKLGQVVIIEKIVGRVAFVRPIETK